MWLAFLSLILGLIIAGVIWWAANEILRLLSPWIAEPFMTLIRIVLVVLVACIIVTALLQVSGLNVRLPFR